MENFKKEDLFHAERVLEQVVEQGKKTNELLEKIIGLISCETNKITLEDAKKVLKEMGEVLEEKFGLEDIVENVETIPNIETEDLKPVFKQMGEVLEEKLEPEVVEDDKIYNGGITREDLKTISSELYRTFKKGTPERTEFENLYNKYAGELNLNLVKDRDIPRLYEELLKLKLKKSI